MAYDKERRREKYLQNREHDLELSRERYEKNRLKILMQTRDRYLRNKKRISDRRKERYQENKEHELEVNRKWSERNREYRREQDKEYRQENKDNIAVSHVIYRQDPKNKAKQAEWQRQYNLRLKEKLRGILGHNACVRCGFSDIRALQFDHINGSGRRDWIIHGFKRSTDYYKYYISHPDEARQTLQVLCSNCNWVKMYENNERGKYNVFSVLSTV